MSRFIYTAVFYLSLPIVIARLWWRAKAAPDYGKRWGERFGYGLTPVAGQPILIHAVSVGEALAAIPLIKALMAQYPNIPIAVTTTTPTGSARVSEALGDQVWHRYLPYDLPGPLARFFNALKPRAVILMETELWPNTLAACRKRQIPVILANARMSERSAKGYQRLSLLSRPMFSSLALAAVQTTQDGERLQALGVKPEVCKITGSVKFDLTITEELRSRAETLKQRYQQRPIWIAASTHPGEDEVLLQAFRQLKRQQNDLMLILVPRHPERFETVGQLCEKEGWQVQRRSAQKEGNIDAGADILLGDTMGEMLLLYGIANMAFVGGSLIEHGGQNLIEPAAWDLPIIAGPHVFNFAEVARLLKNAGGLIAVENAETIQQTLSRWLQDLNSAAAIGLCAGSVARANRGALARIVKAIESVIGK